MCDIDYFMMIIREVAGVSSDTTITIGAPWLAPLTPLPGKSAISRAGVASSLRRAY